LNSVRLFNGIGDVRIGLQHSVGITADSVRWLGAARPSSSVLVAAWPDAATIRGILWAFTPGWRTNFILFSPDPLWEAEVRLAQGRSGGSMSLPWV